MWKRSIILAALTAPLSALLAAPGGQLRVLERGTYQCALPGLAGDTAVVVQQDRDFKVISGSSYRQGEVRGTYLHTGDRVVFTSGTMRGEKFERQSAYTLQELNDDGTLGRLRCVRRGQ